MRIASVDLRREAKAEVDRLTSARALFRNGDERAHRRLESDATWIAVAKRTALKRSLDGRICLVYRVAFEDATVRLSASRLVPVLVGVTREGHHRSRAWLERLFREADAQVTPRVEAACEAWRAEVVGIVSAFASARERRVSGTDGERRPNDDHPQPGLFDRRAERACEVRVAAAAVSNHAKKARLRAIRAFADIVPLPPRLMLVLAPRS
jgi:hypothetical protein